MKYCDLLLEDFVDVKAPKNCTKEHWERNKTHCIYIHRNKDNQCTNEYCTFRTDAERVCPALFAPINPKTNN